MLYRINLEKKYWFLLIAFQESSGSGYYDQLHVYIKNVSHGGCLTCLANWLYGGGRGMLSRKLVLREDRHISECLLPPTSIFNCNSSNLLKEQKQVFISTFLHTSISTYLPVCQIIFLQTSLWAKLVLSAPRIWRFLVWCVVITYCYLSTVCTLALWFILEKASFVHPHIRII